jgi:hypothetical protein
LYYVLSLALSLWCVVSTRPSTPCVLHCSVRADGSPKTILLITIWNRSACPRSLCPVFMWTPTVSTFLTKDFFLFGLTDGPSRPLRIIHPSAMTRGLPSSTFPKDPIYEPQRRLRVLAIGAGASGLLLAYKLQRHFDRLELQIFEKNPAVAGTWFENRYPGCACDVPSHCQ